jgi:hypothetical protein
MFSPFRLGTLYSRQKWFDQRWTILFWHCFTYLSCAFPKSSLPSMKNMLWHLSDICLYLCYFRHHPYILSSAWQALRRHLKWKPVILQRLTKTPRRWRRKFHVHTIWPDAHWAFCQSLITTVKTLRCKRARASSCNSTTHSSRRSNECPSYK